VIETPEKFLSVREVARRLNVSPPTVYRRIAEGELPAFRVGEGRGPIRISERELTEWLYRAEER
jgi:excisionase family DNA binding protein